MFVYRNGVYYIDSLQEAVEAQGDNKGDDSEQIYISIPEDKWDEFAKDFSVQVYNNKADYKRNSLIISALLALLCASAFSSPEGFTSCCPELSVALPLFRVSGLSSSSPA